jgi:hypothetical protein
LLSGLTRTIKPYFKVRPSIMRFSAEIPFREGNACFQHIISSVLRKQFRESRLKSVLVFVMHQFIGTWGTAFVAYFLGASRRDLLVQLGWHPSMRSFYWILSETPYYPVQIVLGLYFGVLLGRRLHHFSMVWVWVLPLVLLFLAVGTNFTLIPEWTSVLERFGTGQSRWSHYFGWGCRPSNHCLDQLEITMPFYVAVAYSIGGLSAQKLLTKEITES